MFAWFLSLAIAQPADVSASEAAWFRIYGDLRPGSRNARAALEQWLASYQAVDTARSELARSLLDAMVVGEEKWQREAWELGREPLDVLRSDRGQRRIERLSPYSRPTIDLGVEGWFFQGGVVLGGVAGHGEPVAQATGGTALIGPQVELFGLEGVVAAGVTGTVDGRWGDPSGRTLRGELLAGVGGDGLLLWAGVGAGSGADDRFTVHELVQIELTSDNDGPWLTLALRAQLEQAAPSWAPESFGEPVTVGARGLASIGFKFGETPD